MESKLIMGKLSTFAEIPENIGQFSYAKNAKRKYNQHAAVVAYVESPATGGVAAAL